MRNAERFSIKQCIQLLEVDFKTFKRWLDKADIVPTESKGDDRIKYLTRAQVYQLAKDHDRTLRFDHEDEPGGVPQAAYKLLIDRIDALEQQRELHRATDRELIEKQQTHILALEELITHQAQLLETIQHDADTLKKQLEERLLQATEHVQHLEIWQKQEVATLHAEHEALRSTQDSFATAQMEDRQQAERTAHAFQSQLTTNQEQAQAFKEEFHQQLQAVIDTHELQRLHTASELEHAQTRLDALAAQQQEAKTTIHDQAVSLQQAQATLAEHGNRQLQVETQLQELHHTLTTHATRQQELDASLADLRRQAADQVQGIQTQVDALKSTGAQLTQGSQRTAEQLTAQSHAINAIQQQCEHYEQALKEYLAPYEQEAAITKQQLGALQEAFQQLTDKLKKQAPQPEGPPKPKRSRKRGTATATGSQEP